jgi:hypothetical protein
MVHENRTLMKHFRKNPQKAGKSIWGKEEVAPSFSVVNNCKNPHRVELSGPSMRKIKSTIENELGAL